MIYTRDMVYMDGRWWKEGRKQSYNLDTFHTVTAARNRKAKARRNKRNSSFVRIRRVNEHYVTQTFVDDPIRSTPTNVDTYKLYEWFEKVFPNAILDRENSPS